MEAIRFLVFRLVSATAPNSLAQLLPGTYAHDILVMHFHTKRRIFLLLFFICLRPASPCFSVFFV